MPTNIRDHRAKVYSPYTAQTDPNTPSWGKNWTPEQYQDWLNNTSRHNRQDNRSDREFPGQREARNNRPAPIFEDGTTREERNRAKLGAFDMPGFKDRHKQIQNDLARNRQIAPGLNSGQITDASGQLLGQLQQSAAGQGPSLAHQQLQQAMQQNMRQQQAMVASANPANQAMMARQAMQAGSQMGGSLAGQSAMARIQEQLAARGQLAGFLGNNQNAQLNQRGLNNNLRLGLGNQDLQNAQLQQSGGIQGARLAEEQRQFNINNESGGGGDWYDPYLAGAGAGLGFYLGGPTGAGIGAKVGQQVGEDT